MSDPPNLRRRHIPMYVRQGDVLHGDEAREAIAIRDSEEVLREVLGGPEDDLNGQRSRSNSSDDQRQCLVRGEVLNQAFKLDTEKLETEDRKPWFELVRRESGTTVESQASLAEVNALNAKVQGVKVETTAKASTNVSGVNVSALNADVTGIEVKAKAEASANVSGANVSVLEAEVTGVEVGATAKAECNATGLDVRAGCVSATGVSARVNAEAEVSTGRAVHVGNVDVTGVGPVGASVKVDAKTGFAAGNVQAGFNCETGVDVSTGVSAFNVNLTYGAPRLSLGLDLNVGVPFMGGGRRRRSGRNNGQRGNGGNNNDDGGGATGGTGHETSGSGDVASGGNNVSGGNNSGNDDNGGQTGANRPVTSRSGASASVGDNASGGKNDINNDGGSGTGGNRAGTSTSESPHDGRKNAQNGKEMKNDGRGGLRGGARGRRRSGSVVSGEHNALRGNDDTNRGGRGGLRGGRQGTKRSGSPGAGKHNSARVSNNGSGESSEPKKPRLMDKYDQMVIDTVRRKHLGEANHETQSAKKTTDFENLDREGIKQRLIRNLKRESQESKEKSKRGSDNNGNAPSTGGLLAGASSTGKASSETQKEVSPAPVKKGKPFGANKNIHGFHTLGTTSDKPLKQLGENIVGFGN